MAPVRERRQKQALRLTVPSPPNPSSWQRLQSPSPLSSSSSNSNPNSNSPTIASLAGFERLAVLGHGNGGTVYKVCDRPANEIYALKVLRPVDDTEKVQKRTMNEAEILRRVDSRFVVVCHGVFEDGFSGTNGGGGGAGDVCFLMEYMEGGSLHDLLQKHPKLPENAISCIARSVLEGLRYLHSMQIVHGDIKPSNLLINSEGRVKIADFGVSRIIAEDDEQQHQCSMGTCAYMSPERIDPERWDGVHSNGYAGDVWSLGVVVMECFTGHFPLIGAGEKPDWITIVSAICSEEEDKRKMLEMASAEIQSFVRMCLQKDWRIRGTVEELLGHPFVTRLEDGATHILNYTSVALAE